MAKQVVDFQKVRKRRQRLTTAKRLLVLAGVALLFFGAVSLNNLLVKESFSVRVSDLMGSFGGSGYPVDLPGGVIRRVKASGDHLAVLNDTTLYVYSQKGKQVGGFPKMSDNTELITSAGRLLTYEVEGKKYAIHSRGKTLLDVPIEYGLLAAGMNDRGDYAIISSAKQAICEVNVYNRRFQHVYTHAFTENIAHQVALSPKGTDMAVGWINAREGMIISGVNLYKMSVEGVAHTVELPDSLILGLYYSEEGRVTVLTDRQYLALDSDGGIRHAYDFGEEKFLGIEREGRQTLLLLEDRDTRQQRAVLLDGELEVKAAYLPKEKVLDMALGTRRAYLLAENAIESLSLKLEPVASDPVQHVSRIQLVKNKLYYLDREAIRLLGQAEEPGEESEADGAAALPDGASGRKASSAPSYPEAKEQESASQDPFPDPSPGDELDGPLRTEQEEP